MKSFYLTLFIFCLSFCSFSQKKDSLAIIKKKIEEGKTVEANIYLDKKIANIPKDSSINYKANLYYLKAYSSFKTSATDASSYLEKSFISNAAHLNAESLTLKGQLLLKDGKKGEACKCFEKAIDYGGENAKSLYETNFCKEMAAEKYNEGRSFYNLKQYEKALSYFNQAIAITGDSASYNKRGLCYFMLLNYDSALIDFNSSIKLSPLNADYYYNRSMVWLAKSENQKAFEDCTESIKLNPRKEVSYFNRAAAEEAMSQQNAAMFDYSEIIRINPTNAMAFYKRGILKESFLNDRKGSCEDYNKAYQLGYEEALENVNVCKKVKKK